MDWFNSYEKFRANTITEVGNRERRGTSFPTVFPRYQILLCGRTERVGQGRKIAVKRGESFRIATDDWKWERWEAGRWWDVKEALRLLDEATTGIGSTVGGCFVDDEVD